MGEQLELFLAISNLADKMENLAGERPNTIRLPEELASILDNPIEIMGMRVVIDHTKYDRIVDGKRYPGNIWLTIE